MPENNNNNNPQYIPGHKHVDHGMPIDAVPTKAKCTHSRRAGVPEFQQAPCPRHNPTAYADAYARHATDSSRTWLRLSSVVSGNGSIGPIR